MCSDNGNGIGLYMAVIMEFIVDTILVINHTVYDPPNKYQDSEPKGNQAMCEFNGINPKLFDAEEVCKQYKGILIVHGVALWHKLMVGPL